jgi:hypothetical protein
MSATGAALSHPADDAALAGETGAAQMRDGMWVDPDIMRALAPWMEKFGVSPPPSSA